MLLVLLLAQATTGAVFTPESARAMPQETLVDALLGTDHPPIARISLEANDMRPAGASLERAYLTGFPTIAPRSKWCRRDDFAIELAPTSAGPDPRETLVPTHVATITPVHFARTASKGCSVDDTFFNLLAGQEATQLSLLDRMLAARALARSGRRLPFRLTCVDRAGNTAPTYGGDACKAGQGRKLLARLRLESVLSVSPSEMVATSGMSGGGQEERRAYISSFDGTLAVDATIQRTNDRISSIALTRHIPYPF